MQPGRLGRTYEVYYFRMYVIAACSGSCEFAPLSPNGSIGRKQRSARTHRLGVTQCTAELPISNWIALDDAAKHASVGQQFGHLLANESEYGGESLSPATCDENDAGLVPGFAAAANWAQQGGQCAARYVIEPRSERGHGHVIAAHALQRPQQGCRVQDHQLGVAVAPDDAG